MPRCSPSSSTVTCAVACGPAAEGVFARMPRRALAALGDKRIEAWPDVATAAEQGFKGFSVEAWYGLLAPAKTPKDKVAELSKWCSDGMKAADLKPKWELQGLDPVGSSSEDFAAHLRKQAADYAQVIREADIKGE